MRKQIKQEWLPLYVMWGFITLFLLILFYKIFVTPFEIDFTILITFLLSLFSMAFMFFMYIRIQAMMEELRQLVNNQMASTSSTSIEPIREKEFENIILLEEQTIRLKEEEQTMLLSKITQQTDTLSDEEKEQYVKRIQEINEEVAQSKFQIATWKDKWTNSLALWFPSIERNKQVKDIVWKLNITNDASFQMMNDRLSAMYPRLSKMEQEVLRDAEYIDQNYQLTRVGYREIQKVLSK